MLKVSVEGLIPTYHACKLSSKYIFIDRVNILGAQWRLKDSIKFRFFSYTEYNHDFIYSLTFALTSIISTNDEFQVVLAAAISKIPDSCEAMGARQDILVGPEVIGLWNLS